MFVVDLLILWPWLSWEELLPIKLPIKNKIIVGRYPSLLIHDLVVWHRFDLSGVWIGLDHCFDQIWPIHLRCEIDEGLISWVRLVGTCQWLVRSCLVDLLSDNLGLMLMPCHLVFFFDADLVTAVVVKEANQWLIRITLLKQLFASVVTLRVGLWYLGYFLFWLTRHFLFFLLFTFVILLLFLLLLLLLAIIWLDLVLEILKKLLIDVYRQVLVVFQAAV